MSADDGDQERPVSQRRDQNERGLTHKVRLGDREIALPRSRLLRIALGVALILGGLIGFLPILGFWMLPLGLLVLSYDLPFARRWRRRLVVWWHRRRERLKREGDF